MLIFPECWRKHSLESSTTSSKIVEIIFLTPTISELLHATSSELSLSSSLAGEYKASKEEIVRMLENKQCDTDDRGRWHRTGT